MHVCLHVFLDEACGADVGHAYLACPEPSGWIRMASCGPSPIIIASPLAVLGVVKLAMLGGSLLKMAGMGKVAER